MDPQFALPAEIVEGASIRGNEYGWPLQTFPTAVLRAKSRGYACVGGQFQFRTPIGVCEMYWLSADAVSRQPAESWEAYCARSCTEVVERFRRTIVETDFVKEALQWPVLKSEIERGLDIKQTVVFVAYLETEAEWLADKPAANQNPI